MLQKGGWALRQHIESSTPAKTVSKAHPQLWRLGIKSSAKWPLMLERAARRLSRKNEKALVVEGFPITVSVQILPAQATLSAASGV